LSVLVVDDPTEGLEAPTATTLVADLLHAAGDRTVLMLGNRPEGIDLVDRTYCLAGGRLVVSSAVASGPANAGRAGNGGKRLSRSDAMQRG
jgi:ABC-type transport system involved in cytochrome bd biosynthesis fused ATPase/permease subunit